MDIENPINIILLHVVKNNFKNGGQNALLLKEIRESESIGTSDWLSDAFSDDIVDDNFEKIFSHALDKTIILFHEKKFDQAYDMIDAFHWLPETIAYNWKVNYLLFFSTRIIPLSKKWRAFSAEEFLDLLSVNWLTRAKLRKKIKFAHQ